ncbi:MAG: hypothetical protein AB2693_31455 [Candidatus Thiodiazotropha sp.]
MSAYLRRWRKCHAIAEAIAEADSSDETEDQQNNVVPSLQDVENINSDLDTQTLDTSLHSRYSFEDLDDTLNESIDESNDWISDSSESDNETSGLLDDSDDKEELSSELATWSTKYKCSRSALNDLLGILRKHGHELPKDSRTLLQTPRNVGPELKCGGQYLFFGIERGVSKILTREHKFRNEVNTIELNVNIDGVPLFKSSNSQLWPILCSFSEFQPFLVALFYGDSKPNSVEEFLNDFLAEFNEVAEKGIIVEEKAFTVTLKAFICDAPARSFLKCSKSHTGYFSCERCTIKGVWKHNRITLHSTEPFPPRTDEAFIACEYNDHQCGRSPLVNIGFECVSRFCLDYMHLVCLGVVKRILLFLKQGPAQCKLSSRQIKEISDNLLTYCGKLPSDFARQPRSLFELDRWKATELRQFLLYTGPLVLRKVVPQRLYEHFLLLTVGISILLDTNDSKRNAYLNYGKDLLKYFVETSNDIYSETFTVYNVHNLVHIGDDAKKFNCSLNEISAFPFENYLRILKHMVRNARNPVVQVSKRLSELEKHRFEHFQRNKLHFISSRMRDCCFMLHNEDFAFVREKKANGTLVCDIIPQKDMENLFTTPCESKLINIAYFTDFRKSRRRLLGKKDLYCKVVFLPYSRGFVVSPMLHTIERK